MKFITDSEKLLVELARSHRHLYDYAIDYETSRQEKSREEVLSEMVNMLLLWKIPFITHVKNRFVLSVDLPAAMLTAILNIFGHNLQY